MFDWLMETGYLAEHLGPLHFAEKKTQWVLITRQVLPILLLLLPPPLANCQYMQLITEALVAIVIKLVS